jgi:hypothetical protein
MRSASAAMRARELVLGELGIGGDQHQHLVEVGGERLGADLVLPVEQVAARLDLLDRAFVVVSRHCTRSPTTTCAFLPRGWQMRRVPSGDSTMQWRPKLATTSPGSSPAASAKGGPHASRASTCAAQAKSVSDRPCTSCVRQRTTQRL